MCQNKDYPCCVLIFRLLSQVVVSEESVEKVTTFCAHKKTGTISKGQNSAEDKSDVAATSSNSTGGSFEFGDFIRAFKVSQSV